MTGKERLSRCKTLFRTFLKIGAFTFGGGYAMIPLIQKETVEIHGWITDEDILNIIAVAEATPGPIAINSATFVGYKVAGFCNAGSCASFLCDHQHPSLFSGAFQTAETRFLCIYRYPGRCNGTNRTGNFKDV